MKSTQLFEATLVKTALKQSFIKLDPRLMVRNPVMFTVEIGTLVMAYVTVYSMSNAGQGAPLYNFFIFLTLLLTVLFANFAEAIAEVRGKAQADSLRKTREETPAKVLLSNGNIEIRSSNLLRKGDVFLCETGDTIPTDGEIIEGIATIDESAITGESAPVIRESGGDKSSVTGGTKVLSDEIKVRVSTEPGESFLDKMIALVEGASRQKTPNEIALTILLASFTLVFIIVCVTLKPFADYANTPITIAALISLFVCLIPTTIGGLLSAIGIAGMDRALRANVITKSGKAVETAGDIDVLLLDKTGTITIGNRKATNFYPTAGVLIKQFIDASVLSSLADETPEGKSIIELARGENYILIETAPEGAEFIKFTAETRSSGINTPDDRRIRKGAFDAIKFQAEQKSIALAVLCADDLPQVNVDIQKTAWVLVNFLSNALRYSPEKSKVSIEVLVEGNTICFAVQDYGKGIEEKYQERLFERYFQVPTDGQSKSGSGLGLAISKDFIEAEHGEIGVLSALGEGSKFYFTLPIAS